MRACKTCSPRPFSRRKPGALPRRKAKTVIIHKRLTLPNIPIPVFLCSKCIQSVASAFTEKEIAEARVKNLHWIRDMMICNTCTGRMQVMLEALVGACKTYGLIGLKSINIEAEVRADSSLARKKR